MSSLPSILRHRTAIRRYGHSRPISLARAHGLVVKGLSVFDYGCGLGDDVQMLRDAGIEADGWDPYYRPDTSIRGADCVNLGYVLNVIEDAGERERTLRTAFDLAKRVLIVSVRVDRSLDDAIEFADGCLTNLGSFQKIYSQSELQDYLYSVLGLRPLMASLGVAYVFKDEAAESDYLANISIAQPKRDRVDQLNRFSEDAIGKSYLQKARELARLPLPQEFPDFPKLQELFGSQQRIQRSASILLGPTALSEARELKRQDILTFVAMMRLRGLKIPPFRRLPRESQADIRALWPSYRAAIEEGQAFLFQMGRPDIVRSVCGALKFGKKMPEDYYIHRSVEQKLPPVLRLLVFAAQQVVGETAYDIVKLSLDGRKVSSLQYREFDEVAHPELVFSVRVYLPTASYTVRDYSNSDNPPILHRKEAFVDPLCPKYGVFSGLTRQEEALGLLSRADIGYRVGWQALLSEKGLELKSHTVERAADAS
jgi:DNA phosphorothioation-associated putative methyltransferase